MAKVRTVTLRNVARSPRKPLVLHLPHEQVCAAMGDCRCARKKVGATFLDPTTRARRLIVHHKRLPDTLSLCAAGTPGDVVKGLSEAVLLAEDVRRHVAKRELEVSFELVDVPDPASAPATPAAPTETKSAAHG
jgi:hypothetical protein